MGSNGSLPQSLAISARVFPCNGSSFGFCTAPTRKDSGPVTSCHSFSQFAARRLHLLANARAGGRILQPLDQFRVAAVVRPWRDNRRKRVEPGGVGVSI